MERREAMRLTAVLLGGTLVGSEFFLSGCTAAPKKRPYIIEDADLPLLDEIGESILPSTLESPGAKAANIGAFIQRTVNDCYSLEEAGALISGLSELEEKSNARFGRGFVELSQEERLELLLPLVGEAREYGPSKTPHFFRMLKELTIWGYFSSEVGTTMALRYNPVPGRYEGCIPYDGENAWAL